MAKNENLHKAKDAKNDEFYTQLSDVSNELMHYKEHFKDKIIFCNCDDPTWSAFWKYFHLNFSVLGLKKLISTHYDKTEPTYKMEYEGGNDNDVEVGNKTPLSGNGDFRNQECIDLLKESDIVVTNPPFSLFREYVAQLIEHDKKFIIIGNMNAVTYKEFFPLLKENKVWVGNGFNLSMIFKTPYPNLLDANRKYVTSKGYNPDDGYIKTPAVAWFTNLDIKKRHEPLILWKQYNPDEYPKYDNYDAINVDKVSDIPVDYEPCWYKCPSALKCKYAQSNGLLDDALCEQQPVMSVANGLQTDRQTDRQTGTSSITLQSVAESWESQSHSSTNTAQNSSELSETNTHSTLTEEEAMSTDKECTQESSLQESCNGVMGVPITFLDSYNPEQFEIVGFCDTDSPLSLGKNYSDYIGYKQDRSLYGRTGSTFGKCPVLIIDDKKHPYYEKDGIRVQATYHRIFIRINNNK